MLYHRRATGQHTQAELQALLEYSQPYQAVHGIVELLLYNESRYIQVLEGTEAAVEYLYALIWRDTRHARVETVIRGPAHAGLPTGAWILAT